MLLPRLASLAFAFASLAVALPDVVRRSDVDLHPRQSNSSTTATGDSKCVTFMCISAVKNGTSVQYTLTSSGSQKVGWMAMGFGTLMANSAMVIMWANSDGTITLSQRKAPSEVMPTLDPSPPRIATAQPSLSAATAAKPSFVYTIDANSDTTQNIVWAFGGTNPGSSSPSASLQQHLISGATTLDLTKALSTSGSSPSTDSGSGSGSGKGSSGGGGDGGNDAASSLPFLPYQRKIIAHAVFVSVGFLILLPAGALLARYLRTYWPGWFRAHWVAQLALAGPAILIGVALGISAVSTAGAPHFDDAHKKWGIVIFLLYLLQCSLGGFIHFVKPKNKPGRPPQNYAHAVFGLLIIGLAFYQVHTGYDHEWPETTGREDVPDAVNIVWIIWAFLLPVLYLAGLWLLRRQFTQERQCKLAQSDLRDEYALNARYSGEYYDESPRRP